MSFMDAITSSVFWIIYALSAVVLWLVFQGYWTRWAHRRINSVAKSQREMEERMDALENRIKSTEQQNPYQWLRRL
mgnify:FL=1